MSMETFTQYTDDLKNELTGKSFAFMPVDFIFDTLNVKPGETVASNFQRTYPNGSLEVA